MKLDELLAEYLLQLEADGRSSHTVRQAERHGRLLAAFLGAREVGDVTHQDVARFLTSAMALRTPDGRAKKPASANALRSSIRCLFAFAHAAGYVAANPARLVRRARCGSPPPRALSDADRERLVRALDGAATDAERRDRALFRLLLGAGLRLGSALALDVGDLDLAAGEVRLRTMKNAEQDIAFVAEDVVTILREHVATRTAGPVFVGEHGRRVGARQVHRRLAWWARRAGIERGVHPHALRHTFATRVYRSTGDLLVTGQALCHRSVHSTAIYAKGETRRVRDAVRACALRATDS